MRGIIQTALKNGSAVILVLLVLVGIVFVRNFASVDNAAVIVRQSAIPAIAVLGMTMVLMTGGIDLSLGFVVGLASTATGLMAKVWGLPVGLTVAATLLLGALVGFVNGATIQYMKVPSFITTLGTGYILYGISQLVSAGNVITRLPPSLLAVGRTNLLGFPTSVYIAVAIVALGWFLIHRSVFGRVLSAFGFNSRVAFLSGLPTARVNVLTYVLCSSLAALAGLLLTIRVNAAQPNMGGGVFTFEVITAAIVGGTSLFGGVGSVIGSLFGVLIIKVIENCINLMNISYHLYLAVQGSIILTVIVMDKIRTRAA
ncbi:MAG: ABC transporter permease [Verrucomicrobia bacterium]|nr:ABC transporter permease [Verrucomicrobiota bacterium]